MGWGAIDASIAIAGRRGARRRLNEAANDSADRSEAEEARRFERIVAINAGLDVLYVIGGAWLARSAGRQRDRQGTGAGIMIQGAWLLGYDLWLVHGVRQWHDASI